MRADLCTVPSTCNTVVNLFVCLLDALCTANWLLSNSSSSLSLTLATTACVGFDDCLVVVRFCCGLTYGS